MEPLEIRVDKNALVTSCKCQVCAALELSGLMSGPVERNPSAFNSDSKSGSVNAHHVTYFPLKSKL